MARIEASLAAKMFESDRIYTGREIIGALLKAGMGGGYDPARPAFLGIGDEYGHVDVAKAFSPFGPEKCTCKREAPAESAEHEAPTNPGMNAGVFTAFMAGTLMGAAFGMENGNKA